MPRRNVPAPNRPRWVGPAPNCPVAELAAPNRRRRIGGAELSHSVRLVSDSTRRSLMFWHAWCHEHSTVMATELFITFAAVEPRLWNSLPVQLHNPDITYRLFWRQLKGHLFREAWTWRSVTSDMRRHRKTLTYLHLAHGSLRPPETTTQTGSQSVQLCLQGSPVWSTHRHR